MSGFEQTESEKQAAIAHSYREYLVWSEHAEQEPTPRTAFGFAFGAGQVYQANLDAHEPTPGLATLRVPRDMLGRLATAAECLVAALRLAQKEGEGTLRMPAMDLAAVQADVRLLDHALQHIQNGKLPDA